MLKIEAIIPPDALNGVVEALGRVRCRAVQVSEVATIDPTRHPNRNYRGAGYSVGRPRVKLELVVEDHEVERTIDLIRSNGTASDEDSVRFAVLELHDMLDPGAPQTAPGRGRPEGTVVRLRRDRGG